MTEGGGEDAARVASLTPVSACAATALRVWLRVLPRHDSDSKQSRRESRDTQSLGAAACWSFTPASLARSLLVMGCLLTHGQTPVFTACFPLSALAGFRHLGLTTEARPGNEPLWLWGQSGSKSPREWAWRGSPLCPPLGSGRALAGQGGPGLACEERLAGPRALSGRGRAEGHLRACPVPGTCDGSFHCVK